MSLLSTSLIIVPWMLAMVVRSTALQQPPKVASIVEQFYPKRLTELTNEFGGRQQCFAVYDRDVSGAPRTIVAAYTNHTEAAVRVLRSNPGGFDVAAEPQGKLELAGVWCEVALVDVDADGRKEIRVDFSVNRATVSWLFKWDGQRLQNLTPTSGTFTGYQRSEFVNGGFVDVDNDGTQEIYAPQEYPRFPDEPVLPADLYRLKGEHYEREMRLVGLWSLTGGTSTPETETISVDVPVGALGPFTLRVVNGLPDRTARAVDIHVSMNGLKILAPGDFSDRNSIIERPVMLGLENKLVVRFAGQPSSQLLVVIKSDNWGKSGH